MHAMETPLKDTHNLIHRLHAAVDMKKGQGVVASTFDFVALYTNFVWSDVAMAYKYWRQAWHATPGDQKIGTVLEKAFVDWLFEPVSAAAFQRIAVAFPFFQNGTHTHHIYRASIFKIDFHPQHFQRASGWNFHTGIRVQHGDQLCPRVAQPHAQSL